MELFARLSCTYPAGDGSIKNDDEINRVLNDKLTDFIKNHKIQKYRILNGQTLSLPKPAFGPGTENVQCSLNIAYTKFSESE